jgi:hypothetical protein
MAHYGDHLRGIAFDERTDYMVNHGLPGNLVKRFGQGRLHSLAKPCR